jgi:long-chain acyl-CoA synthetase
MTKALDFRLLERWWRPSNGRKPISDPTEELQRQQQEQPWLTQLDKAGLPRSLVYPSTTLARALDQTADRFGAATAMTYGEKRWTYAELLAQVNRMAGGLAALGVRRGDRVLLTLPNCPEFVVAFFAIQKLGGVAVNAGPLMGADDFELAISMTTPRVTIGLDLQAPLLLKVCHGSTVQHSVWVSLQLYQPMLKRVGYQFKLWQQHAGNGDGMQHQTLSTLMAQAPARPPTVEPDPSQLAVLQPTGGTTGTLKLVELSHRNLLSNATQMAVWMGSRMGQERHLAVLPMFHVYGLTTCLVSAVCSAAAMILATRFQARETIDLVRRHRPTLFPVVPAICHAISDALERDTDTPTKLEGVRLCVSGAAPLTQDVAERFTRLTGVTVVEGYGLTEAGPVTHVNLPGQPRFGSIGLPVPDTRCRVVDLETGRDVARGEAGEMLIAGPQVMAGYLANPADTRRVLTTDEHGTLWLHTGDVVRCDEDGYFYVLDRKKDMIIRSGLKVYPARVEAVLRTHDRVADVAVIGRPDPVHTEIVVAFIVRKDLPQKEPAQSVDALTGELRSLCREHLAPYEVPAAFEFTEQIPRSPLGKVLKKTLRMRPPAAVPVAAPAVPKAGSNGKEMK